MKFIRRHIFKLIKIFVNNNCNYDYNLCENINFFPNFNII